MRILFICSGNKSKRIKSNIKNLEIWLMNNFDDLIIEYYIIKGKGVLGYLRNIKPLKKYLKRRKYDFIHAHYAFLAYVASLAGVKSLNVTLMGSDLLAYSAYKYLIKFFACIFNWENIIVQSKDMKDKLGINKAYIIPNGVDLNVFLPMDKTQSKIELGWNIKKKHILFPANPKYHVKNYELVEQSLALLNDNNIEIHCFEDIPHKQTPLWYNAADVILLTSLWEGSPNVIKEAMACNKPIVATPVGDIPYLSENEEGHFITTFDVNDCVDKIKQALLFSNTNYTKGRERIILLKLDNISFVKKLVELYEKY